TIAALVVLAAVSRAPHAPAAPPAPQPADESPSEDGGDSGDLHRLYGFDGLIISKFDDGLLGLAAGDVDGDGHGDLAVVNNAKARIQLLLHRAEGEPLEPEALELTNELPDEVHFRREALAT